MCMDEFVKRLYDFMGIYRIFWSQNSHYRYLSIFTDILLIFIDIYRYLPIFYQYFFKNSSTSARACSIVGIFRWKNQRFYQFVLRSIFLCFFFSMPAKNRFFDNISIEKNDFLFLGLKISRCLF